MSPVTREEYNALFEIVRRQNMLIEKLYYQHQRFLGVDDEHLEAQILALRLKVEEQDRSMTSVSA